MTNTLLYEIQSTKLPVMFSIGNRITLSPTQDRADGTAPANDRKAAADR